MKKFFILGFFSLFFAYLLCIFIQYTSLPSLCVNYTQHESVSPDGILVATVFERDCGATTGFSTQVNIRHVSESFDSNSVGNILVTGSRNTIDLSWTDRSHLSVSLFNTKIFKKAQIWDGIRITYIFKKSL